MFSPRSFCRHTLVAAAFLTLFARTPLSAEEKLPPELDCIPADACRLVSIRLADLWRSPATDFLRDKDGDLAQAAPTLLHVVKGSCTQEVEQVERVSHCFLDTPTASVVVIRCRRPLDRERVRTMFGPGLPITHFSGPEQKLDGRPFFVREHDWSGLLFLDDHTFALGKVPALEAFVERRRAQHGPGPLSAALAAAAHNQIVIAGRLPASLEKQIPAWPGKSGPLPLGPLLTARWGLVAVDLQKESRLCLRLTYPEASQAAQGEEALRTLRRRLVRELPGVREELADLVPPQAPPPELSLRNTFLHALAFLKVVEGSLDRAAIRRDGNVLEASARAPTSRGALEALFSWQMVRYGGPLLGIVEEPWLGRGPSNPADNLARLGRAMQKYQNEHGHLPPAALCGKDGRPLLSWRVLLLPYLGEKELLGKFRLDEPWDGPHNRKLIPQMPAVFHNNKGIATVPTTCFQVFAGKGTAFEGDRGLRRADFKDPLEQTVLIAEATVPVPWTKPQDLDFPARGPLPKVGRSSTLFAVFADGKVRQVWGGWPRDQQGEFPAPRFNESVLRALITRSGGEPGTLLGIGPKGDPSPGGYPAHPAPDSPGVGQTVGGTAPLPTGRRGP